MTFSFGLSPWLLLLSALGAGALTAWLYHRTTPELPRWKRGLLGLLRFGALFLILFLLLEPVLRMMDREERRPVVAVLVDDSQSLHITAASDSLATGAQARIDDLLAGLPAALRDVDVQFFRFGAELAPQAADAIDGDSLRFDASRTNISRALDQVRERLRDENFRAAVLVSDGRFNTGRNPLYTAERYPVPIFTSVVGDTSRHIDLQIRRVTTNEIAYVGSELPVQVGVRSDVLEGAEVTVSLARNGAVLSSKRVTLPDGSAEVNVDLTVMPEEAGLHTYTIAVSRMPGEITFRNNQESVAIRVLESRRRVLLLAAAPGPDVAAARQLVASDPTLGVSTFVQRDADSFYEGPLPSRLDTFDVFLLAGYPGAPADGMVLDRIHDAAEEGTPLFFLATTNTAAGLIQEHLGGTLPVNADRVRTGFVEAALVPTPEGLSHPIMDIPEATPASWLRYPPLAYTQTRWTPSPDAIVLASTSVRGVSIDDPLLVIRRRGGTRSAALLGAGTWRWHNVPQDLDALDHLWPTLFSNTLQWLTARRDDRPVRVAPARDLFGGDESVQLSGQVYDESLNPVRDASVEVEVTAPDGTVYPYVMSPIGNGRYTLDAGAFPQGTYTFTATASLDDHDLGSDRGTFAVGSLTLEYKETRADAILMRQIAQRSGGEPLDAHASDQVARRLSASAQLTGLVVEHETETELRRLYLFLALIVILLTAEWLIRKRSGLV